MAVAICEGGLVSLAQQWKTFLNSCTLRLFQNNHVPASTDTVANYTEATFTGYAAIATVSWGNAYLNGALLGEIDEVNRTFTQTANTVTNTIFGYYITDVGGNLIFAESNPLGGFNMNAAGLVYIVQARIVLDNA